MDRTAQIEKVMTLCGLDKKELTENLLQTVEDGLARVDVSDPHIKDIYNTAEVLKRIVNDVATEILNEITISDMTAEDLAELIKFMESPAGKKWITVKDKVKELMGSRWAKLSGHIGKHYAHMFYVRLTKLFIELAHQMKPDIGFDEMKNIVSKYMEDNPIFPIKAKCAESKDNAMEAARKLFETFERTEKITPNQDEQIKTIDLAAVSGGCCSGERYRWPTN